jgi:hypothetical protein
VLAADPEGTTGKLSVKVPPVAPSGTAIEALSVALSKTPSPL